MEDFRAHTNGISARRRSHRHNHEFLNIDRVIGMGAAVDDIHHRHRKCVGECAADITVKRQTGVFGSRFRNGQTHAKNSVGSKTGFVRRSVQINHRLVDQQLIVGIKTGQRFKNFGINGFNGFRHALTEIAALVTIAQLHGLVHTGRSAGRHGGPAKSAGFQNYIDLNGRVATGVDDFTSVNIDDLGHFSWFLWLPNRRHEFTNSLFRQAGNTGKFFQLLFNDRLNILQALGINLTKFLFY